ncbi:hypothetical protein JCM3770_001496 [Rhodotorula araucariae]
MHGEALSIDTTLRCGQSSRRSRDPEQGGVDHERDHGDDERCEKGPRDIATPTEPRPATEEPPLETGSASLPSKPRLQRSQDIPSAYRTTHPAVSVASLLVFATIWGVLARLGLEWVGGFATRAVFSLVWAQMVGCFVMGFVTTKKNDIERIFPPLFVMCGTGFCGSLTTWSSMSSDVFGAFANLDQPAGTSRFAGFLSGMTITVVTLSSSMAAFQVGHHLGGVVPSPSRHPRPRPGQLPVTLVTVLLGPLFWLGALFLLIFGPATWRPRATFAIVVGPPGTLLRYLVSRHLNRVHPSLPYGTLLVNSSSVLVFAVAAVLARHPRGALGCAALKGVQDGFCGSLSTISTLVVELRGLKTGESYRYFLVSWVVSQGLFVVVLGSWVWSGDRGALCWERRLPAFPSFGCTPLCPLRLAMFSPAKLLALASLAALVAANHGFVMHPRRQHSADPALAPSAATASSPAPDPSSDSSASMTSAMFIASPSVTAASPALAANATDTSVVAATPSASFAFASTATAPADTAIETASATNVTSAGTAEVSIDVTVLQLAFVLENLEATFYQQALEKFSLEVMVAAGLSHFQAAIVIEQVAAIQIDEATHVAVIADTLVALGAEPFAGCGFNFDAALADPMTFLSTARVLEATGVSAYLGAAHLLTDPSLLLAASSIVTLESRHQSLLNVLNGGSYSPQAFDLPLTPQGVLALAGGFLDGCDAGQLGLTANEALTIVDEATQAGRFVPGSKLSFQTVAVVDISTLTCQMLIGGQPVALTLPAQECVVPAGIDGPVAVYLTDSSTPLATSVIIQAQASIVAGPGLIFVDAQVSVLASVLSPLGAHGAGGSEGWRSGGRKHKLAQGEPEVATTNASAEVATTSEAATATTAAQAESVPSASSSTATRMASEPSSPSPRLSESAAAAATSIAARFARRAAKDRRALPTIKEALGKRQLA